MDEWESIAERKIQEAMKKGAFDNLPDRGKPIPLGRNPFEDPSMWMAHHLLRVNGFAPAWVQEARDLDQAAERVRAILKDRSPQAIAQFRDCAAHLNRQILTYNLKCPSTQLHKRLLDVEAEIRAALSQSR